jgi:hypothetical protein
MKKIKRKRKSVRIRKIIYKSMRSQKESYQIQKIPLKVHQINWKKTLKWLNSRKNYFLRRRDKNNN